MDLEKKYFVSLDLETTGLDSNVDSIIEVALVRFDEQGNIIKRYSSLIFFAGELPDFVSNLTGIAKSDLLLAPAWEQVKREIQSFLKEDDVLIGHNINFDLSFLANAGVDLYGWKFLDSWYLATILIGNANSYSLEYLLKIIGKEYQAHRALDDTLAVVDLFVYWQKELAKISDKVLKIVSRIAVENDLSESFLYDLENQKRIREKRVVTINVNRLRQRNQTKNEKNYTKEVVPGLNYFSNNFKGLLASDRPWGMIVVSSGLWKNIIREDDFEKYGLIRIDRRGEYLCKDFWNIFYKKKIGSKPEARVVVKILLKIDQGFWDGYLGDIVWFNEEKKWASKLACRKNNEDHDCYYDRKLKYIAQTENDLILPISAWDESFEIKRKQLTIFSEDPLLEDGLTELTGIKFDRDDWLNCQEELSDLIEREKLAKKRVKKLSEMIDRIELVWRALLFLVRSQGQQQDRKSVLDFTPAILGGVAYLDFCQRWVDLKKDYNDVFSEINGLTCLKRMCQVLNGLCKEHEWLGTMIEYEGGYFRLELKKIKFDLWLEDLLQKFSTVNLVNIYPARENNYCWRLVTNREINIQDDNSKTDLAVKNISWKKYRDNLDWKSRSSQLIIFSSKADLQAAKNGLVEENMINNRFFELGNRRGAWYYDLFMGNLKGVVLSSFGNLAELNTLNIKFDMIYLDRLPFDPPNKFILASRAQEWEDSFFGDYYLPRMYQKLYYVFTLLKPNGQFYLGDDRWLTKNYVNKIKKWL